MFINIALLISVFGLPRRQFNLYAVAGIYGALKAVTFFLGTRNLQVAAIACGVGFLLALATRYLFCRLDRYEKPGEEYSKYSSRQKSKFKWEYIPLTTLVLTMIFVF